MGTLLMGETTPGRSGPVKEKPAVKKKGVSLTEMIFKKIVKNQRKGLVVFLQKTLQQRSLQLLIDVSSCVLPRWT